MVLRYLLAASLLTLAFVPTASAATQPDPYCWFGLGGSECGVDFGDCNVSEGNNMYTKERYAHAGCQDGPVGECDFRVSTTKGIRTECGPL